MYLFLLYSSDGACRHIGAALIELEDTLRQNEVVTCTGEKCVWKRRKRTHNEASNLEDMTFTKPEIGKKKKKAVKPSTRNYDPRPKAAVNNENLVEQFRELLINKVPSVVGLHLLPDPGLNEATEAIEEITEQNIATDPPLPSDNPSIKEQPFHLGCISPFRNHPPSVDEIKQKAQGIKRKLNFTEDEINFIEKKTKLQSQESDWFLYRKGRVTASKCKRVASLKPTTSPSKTMKELLVNNSHQSTAMLQELQNEDSIAEAFINKLDSEGKKGVFITKCGFFISKTHGFLGASPDGVITDEEESTPGVVEFKYIQVKPGETLTDVLLRQHICLKVQHNNTVIIQLNKNHKYYFQLYQQMFVTEYHWGVLIAQGTDGGLFYEKVKFTEEFWSPILKNIELFFDTFLVYELAYPRVQLGLERVAF